MFKRIRIGAIAVLGALSGCLAVQGTIDCTCEYVYGINVLIRDAHTDEPLASGATVTIRDFKYVEELKIMPSPVDSKPLCAYGAGERPGTYSITIEKPGYKKWERSGVAVTADECHVKRVTVNAYLERE
jgi:hypothetical protein